MSDLTLSPPMIEALELLSDEAPHGTHKEKTGRHGRLNGNVAARLYERGLARFDRCAHCGHGNNEYVITQPGLDALAATKAFRG